MNRPRRFCIEWCGVLVAAGLLAILWGFGATAAGEFEPQARPATRLLATPVRFQDLIRYLDDPRPAIRLEAIRYLEVLNRPARDKVPALVRRFDDPDLRVRIQAVRVAIRAGMPPQQGVPVAAQLLVPDRPDVCCLAAQILGQAGPSAKDALPQLHACQTASSVWVRLHAARAVLLIDATDMATLHFLRSLRETEQGAAREFAASALAEGVSRLTGQLGHVDPSVRLAAAIRLEQLGTDAASAAPALIRRFADPDLLVRAHAARAALRTGAPAQQVVDVVSELLVVERFDVLRVAALTLVEIGPAAEGALPKLHDCLDAPAIAVRLHAAEAALRIDPTDLFAPTELRSALDHQETDVRYFAVNALGAAVLDSDEAVFALQLALSDADPQVATAAALQLSRTHDLARHDGPDDDVGDQVVDADDPGPMPLDVMPWISELTDAAAGVRRVAAIRLAITGPAARDALPILIDLLLDPNPVVRLHVAQAIWEIDRNADAIVPVLVDLLSTNDGDTRIGAAYALGRIGPFASASDTVTGLVQSLNGSKTFERLPIAAAIIRIEPTREGALEVLLRGLCSPNADVRYLSAVALGAAPLCRQVAVEQALHGPLADVNSRVRFAACETLGQLQVRSAVARSTPPAPPAIVVPAEATVK